MEEIKRPWLKKYDPGVPHHIDYPVVPLYHFLEEDARKYPDHVAIIFKGGKITFRQLDELTDRMAAGLAKMGVKKGDRVAILMANCPQFIISYFGILKGGRHGGGLQPPLRATGTGAPVERLRGRSCHRDEPLLPPWSRRCSPTPGSGTSSSPTSRSTSRRPS
jgi:hypothetical protein